MRHSRRSSTRIEAMQPGAPLIHNKERNIVSEFKLTKGDWIEAFGESDVVHADRYYTNQVYQAYLEPMACVAQSGSFRKTHLLRGHPDPLDDPRPSLRQGAGTCPWIRCAWSSPITAGPSGPRWRPTSIWWPQILSPEDGKARAHGEPQGRGFHGRQSRGCPCILTLKSGRRKMAP